jgi:hypothetical protein
MHGWSMTYLLSSIFFLLETIWTNLSKGGMLWQMMTTRGNSGHKTICNSKQALEVQ